MATWKYGDVLCVDPNIPFWGWVYGEVLCITLPGAEYPSASLVRVTGLVHRWSPGHYSLEVALGGVSTEYGMPQYTAVPTSLVPEPTEPVPPAPTPPGPGPAPDPVVINCPEGYKMVYGDWDYYRQYPYCEKVEAVEPSPNPPDGNYLWCRQLVDAIMARWREYMSRTGDYVSLEEWARYEGTLGQLLYCQHILDVGPGP